MREHIEEETKVGGGISVLSEVMAAQEIVSFGYGSQSREIMEVEDYSAKSECYGAFERRRETSPFLSPFYLVNVSYVPKPLISH